MDPYGLKGHLVSQEMLRPRGRGPGLNLHVDLIKKISYALSSRFHRLKHFKYFFDIWLLKVWGLHVILMGGSYF